MKILYIIVMVAILVQVADMRRGGRKPRPPSKSLIEAAEDLKENLCDMRGELEECLGEEIPVKGFEKITGGAVKFAHVLRKKVKKMRKYLRNMSAKLTECRELEAAAAAETAEAAAAAAAAAARAGAADATTDATAS